MKIVGQNIVATSKNWMLETEDAREKMLNGWAEMYTGAI